MNTHSLFLLAFVACGGASQSDSAGRAGLSDTDTDTDTDTTDTDTTNTDTTDTDPTDTDTTTDTDSTEDSGVNEEVVLSPTPPAGSPALLTGMRVTCADGEAALVAELIGSAGIVEVTPIVDGTLLESSPLAVTEGSLFHRAEGTLSVADCDRAGWRVVATANGVETCLVAGPGVVDWLASSGANCELR